LIFTDPKFLLFGVTNIGDADRGKALGVKMLPPGLRYFKACLENDHIVQGWNHVTITIDNTTCTSQLWYNGKLADTLVGVLSPLNVGYVGNNRQGNEPFG
jgi:hypothetical protein